MSAHARKDPATDAFRVDPWMHVLGGWVARHRRACIRLGNLETRLLREDLEQIAITAPIHIAGLARSGSTILLEILSRHPQTASHCYRDYPMLFTPYGWQRFLERVPRRHGAPAERAHGDGIEVTADSPEAFEEMLWMAFFPSLHDTTRSAVLDADSRNPAFEDFYRDHIRKLLQVRGASRYLSKGNYNITRLQYLLTLFPDARFIIPIRDPLWHIASLMKQQRRFRAGQRAHDQAVAHLQRVGHFEFGVDRRPINAGDRETVQQIEGLWRDGAEVEGWARYWSYIHHYLADRMEADPALRAAAMLVRFESLCRDPERIIRDLLAHCHLPILDGMPEREAARIHFPDYYQPEFTDGERDVIRTFTESAAARLTRLEENAGPA